MATGQVFHLQRLGAMLVGLARPRHPGSDGGHAMMVLMFVMHRGLGGEAILDANAGFTIAECKVAGQRQGQVEGHRRRSWKVCRHSRSTPADPQERTEK
ncbi:hypothetical protein D3C72_1984230 [compost metagenome]